MSSKEEEMVISIRNWVYTFDIFGDFKVFTGAVVQYDEKRIMYRESDLEYRFVSVATPGLSFSVSSFSNALRPAGVAA